jgi:hypothetical protein
VIPKHRAAGWPVPVGAWLASKCEGPGPSLNTAGLARIIPDALLSGQSSQVIHFAALPRVAKKRRPGYAPPVRGITRYKNRDALARAPEPDASLPSLGLVAGAHPF